MELLVISLAAMAASALTLFSGFGLGTLLLPVFALFVPLPVAVGMTAVVHLSNNLFKLAFYGKYAQRRAVLAFGIPALLFSLAGAWLLVNLGHSPWIKPVMGGLIFFFALFDLIPALSKHEYDPKWLGLGGALSGFLGGLSGHQGALRSGFLIRLGLSKESFIGTGVVLACVVDVARLGVYGLRGVGTEIASRPSLVLAGVLSAFAGVFVGSRMVKKVTLVAVQRIVAAGLALVGLAMAANIL